MTAAASLPAVVVRSLGRGPIVYRKRIEKAEKARAGDLTAVYDRQGELMGYGFYNPRSEIALRMVRRDGGLPDGAFWDELFRRAVSLRRDLLRLDDASDTYRFLHAEADGVSGLTVDRYGDVLSATTFSLAMHQRAEEILQRLAAVCGARHWLAHPAPAFSSQEGFDPPAIRSENTPHQVTIHEHQTQFRVRFADAHKTGFFCDQRENRRGLAEFCRDKTVLDLCCYTGGFAVQAKRLGQAKEATGVDLDEEPLKLARVNASLNRVKAKFVCADVFPYMRDMLAGGRRFDVVALDPPKLIRSRDELAEGTRKHFDLNRLAVQLVAPGGLLLSCTCSGLLGEEEFRKLLLSAAHQGGRSVQILARTGAAADHPIASDYPQSEYLQAFWLYVRS